MNEMQQRMINKAVQALQYAYAPYSNYAVASCICTEDEQLFVGVNVENGSYGLTLCAEAAAIAQMVATGRQRIKSIVIMAGNNELCPPCGACRQRIHEFSTPETQVYLCNQETILETMTIDSLLPLAFEKP